MRLADSPSTTLAPTVKPRRTPAGLLQLQSKAGNRAVSRLVAASAPPTPAPVTDSPPVVDLEAVAKPGHDELTSADAAPPPGGDVTIAGSGGGEPVAQRDDAATMAVVCSGSSPDGPSRS